MGCIPTATHARVYQGTFV
uniref:Uncharacterized protein n=1 Tax=Anguilla anguilla TaxID=7936 RepID=A0A0E9PI61_ANGAN